MSDSEQLSPALRLVQLERRRQVAELGFTPAHDDVHVAGDLARAGIAYASAAIQTDAESVEDLREEVWPFEDESFKPSMGEDVVTDLVKAISLLTAELDRALRLQARFSGRARR